MNSSKIHITKSGALNLQKELEQLWKVERPKLTQAVAEAAAMGDRSENAEYIFGKKKLREIDKRIRWLQKRLDEVIIVEERPVNTEKIFFGAHVKLKNNLGKILEYQIVGPDELDIMQNLITLSSPIGQALKGRQKGDIVEVKLPKGPFKFEVLDIWYD